MIRVTIPCLLLVAVLGLTFAAMSSAADSERYFRHLAPDAILFGTDARERWDLEALRALVEPWFAKGIGTPTAPTAQNVYVAKEGKTAWFDERLKSVKQIKDHQQPK